MWEIAPDFKAMIVFAEHRYYGESLPFGKDSFSDLAHLGYLTSEQALADFDVLISSLREEYDSNLQVVAFGGSYGGKILMDCYINQLLLCTYNKVIVICFVQCITSNYIYFICLKNKIISLPN
jgi:hypothetical protein